MPPALARELRARVARLFNGYGPTETTVYSTVAEIPPEVDVVTIGEPIANTQAYVLDSRRRPVPVGVPGELYLGGHGLAKGYLRQSELTDQRFADHVFGPVQARLYRTGDLCRWLPDGRLAHIGRADDQVKVRGHRVELGEIEARLLEHPTVAAAAAALRGSEEARLVGYVVARGGAVVDAAILRRHLAELLPAAMVPEDWMTLPRLPVTPNGKLDRNALPEPAQQRAVGSEPSRQEPDEDPGGVVARIRTIWQEVLRVDAIALDEDLFDLGGHSLSITRINGRIQQQLGVLVPLDAFFDTPTLGEIADLVLKMRGVDA